MEQYILAEEYPVASTPPDVPNRICQLLDPFVLTAENITVIRFTQLGIDVKSTDVPDADTDVPEINGASVPVAATSVCVFDPATAGADTVIDPLVSPERTKEAIIYP